MTEIKKQGSNKKILIGGGILLIAILLMIGLYLGLSEKPVVGDKTITVTVIDDEVVETLYETNTDAEFLLQVLEELQSEGLTYSGTGAESEMGLMIDTVNGLLASYEADKAYWSIMVNGDYGAYGVSSQPIADGDNFEIVYTKE